MADLDYRSPTKNSATSRHNRNRVCLDQRQEMARALMSGERSPEHAVSILETHPGTMDQAGDELQTLGEARRLRSLPIMAT